MQTMSIGRLARLTGVSIDTVRYYERHGLLPKPARRAEQKVEQVEHKIEQLRRVRRGLKRLIAACPGHGELRGCPIVAALSDEGSSGRNGDE